eukprot:14247926-Ditylum_brightwellii.AAC.1
MSTLEEVPLKYKSSLKQSEILYIKVQCTGASGVMVKEEISKFSGKELMKHYLLCIKKINTLAKRYKWWMTAANGADLAFKT